MIPYYVALVSEIEDLSEAEVMKVAAALQKQAIRDFAPAWRIDAIVSPFAALEDVPLGYWPIIVEHDIGYPGAAGIHLDQNGQPFALVQFSKEWSLTASHECLEMLADPFGSRLVAGDSIMPGQGRVEYLVEVSDPSEDKRFGYTVNGVLLSDFYTPRYFDPVTARDARYSFTAAITKPRQVLKGGYLSWHDPTTDHWFQAQFFTGSKVKFVDLGKLDTAGQSLRSVVDAASFERAHRVKELPSTPKRETVGYDAGPGAALTVAMGVGDEAVTTATRSRADALRAQIQRLRAAATG